MKAKCSQQFWHGEEMTILHILSNDLNFVKERNENCLYTRKKLCTSIRYETKYMKSKQVIND